MTAYELRISDWSLDVCSSDLTPGRNIALKPPGEHRQHKVITRKLAQIGPHAPLDDQPGRGQRRRLAGKGGLPLFFIIGHRDEDRDARLKGHYRPKSPRACPAICDSIAPFGRSEEPRVGTAGVRPCRSRGSPYPTKKKNNK